MNEWNQLYISKPADREAVALILYRAGYVVRESKRKDGGKTVVFVEYRKEARQC